MYFCLRNFGTNVCQKWTFATGYISSPAINARFKLACVRSLAVFKQSCCVQSRSNCYLNRQALQARFKQALVFFGPPEIINFLLKSFSVITSVQNKQIFSFDDLETHKRSIVLVGVKPIIFPTSKGNLRHQLQVTPLLIFGAKRKRKPFKRDKTTSRDFVARSLKNGRFAA